MTAAAGVLLADYTTLRLGGPAARFVQARTEAQLIETVRAADASAEPVLVLGGGSNLVVADAGFPGTVIRVATRGIHIPAERAIPPTAAAPPAGPGVMVAVAAGEDWDSLVRYCIGAGLSGLECLSGIPGLAGATPIQNVGAYGHEVAETIVSVRAYDRLRGVTVRLANADCGFGYRTSALRPARSQCASADPAAATGRFVVLEVVFALRADPASAPVRYPELACKLGVPEGSRVPLADARAAVLGLRRRKGMVIDPADPDTRSAGSFFTNPVLSPGQLAALELAVAARAVAGTSARTSARAPASTCARAAVGAAARGSGRRSVPRFPAPDGRVKVPAAWLIEQAGFRRGYPPGGAARISAKHTLALTNPGGADAAGLLALAAEIRDGVRAAFGIELRPEPVLVGAGL